MADETAELLVSIRADLSDLKAKFNEGKEKGQEFGEAFNDLGKKLLAFFAVEKVVEFAKESIKAFGEMQRSIEMLGNAVKAEGLNWEKTKDSLLGYASSIEATTRFQDDVVMNSMAELLGVTKDIESAMKLNNIAMDLAVGKNIDLATASNVLSLAYAGNEKGITQLARMLKVTGENAKDVGFLMGEVERRFNGAAQGEQNLGVEMSRLAGEFQSFGKDMVGAFEPAIRGAITLTKDFVGAAREAITYWKEFFGMVDEHSGKDVIAKQLEKELEKRKQLVAMRDFEVKQWQTATGVFKESTFIKINLHDQEIKAQQKKIDTMEALLKRETKDVKAATAEQVLAEARANALRLSNEKATQELLENMAKEDLEREKKSIQEREALYKKYGETITGVFQSTASAMTKAFQEGTLTVANAFEALGKAILKSIVNAFADSLAADAAKDFIAAAAAIASVVGAPAAPGLFASGTIKAAGAGTIRGMAEVALADGGYVDAPTLALIGEDGPEKVTPLSKGHALDKGGAFTYNMSFPNVRAAKDFSSRDVSTMARKMFSLQQEMNTRFGQRSAFAS